MQIKLFWFSYAWYFKNDTEKLEQLLTNLNALPLGSGALAGNPFNIDRNALAYSLGFDSVTQNSMQAVGDRDFVGKTIVQNAFNFAYSRIFILGFHGGYSPESSC